MKGRYTISQFANFKTPLSRKQSLHSDNTEMSSLPSISQTSRMGKRICIVKLVIYIVQTVRRQTGAYQSSKEGLSVHFKGRQTSFNRINHDIKSNANTDISQVVSHIMDNLIERNFDPQTT
jgi:hypothetical protein